MSNYSSLKATINANVKQNGNQEITGAIMNSVLNAMVDSLGAGYQYKGVATPATNPGTPDYNVFYLASEAGTYTNFGGLVIGDNEVAALVYNGSWSKQTTGAATASEVSQLAQEVFEQVAPENPNLLDINNLNIGSTTGANITYSVTDDVLAVTCSVNTSQNLVILLPDLEEGVQYRLTYHCPGLTAVQYLYYPDSTYVEIPQDASGNFDLTFTGKSRCSFIVRLRNKTVYLSDLSLVKAGVQPYERFTLDKLKDIGNDNFSDEFKAEMESIVKDKADIDYGVKAGYTFQYISGNTDYTQTENNGVIHIDKTGATAMSFRLLLTGLRLGGSYDIHFESSGSVSNDAINLVNGNTTLQAVAVVDNEADVLFSYDGTYVLGVSLAMKYNSASQDFIVTVKEHGVTGIAVVADNISERVALLEEGGILEKRVSDTNTFVGAGAGGKNTPIEGDDNGHYNTALGEGAMEQNTLGDHSTAVGFCALRKNTTGRNNTAVGEDALYENLTGGQNVAVGQHAAQNSTGGYNVFIGSNVARHLASGNSNIIIGAEAYNSEGQTGCSNVVLIGPGVLNSGNYDGVISINGTDPTAAKEIRIGKADFSAFIIGNKRLNFNNDGTVTWTDVTP